MTKLASALALTAVATGAVAQTAGPIVKPFRVDLGLYVPLTGYNGIDDDLGGSLGFGYDFYQIKEVRIGAAVRGSFFSADDGNQSADITLSSFLVTGTFRPVGSKVFAVAGLGAGRADLRDNGLTFTTDTEFVYSTELGYDFSDSVFGLLRYQGSSNRGLRGLTVGVGFRF